MNQTMSQKRLEQVFDQAAREITERTAGIRLQAGSGKPNDERCTVCTSFHCGYKTSVSLCADRSLFTRLAQRMMQSTEVSALDVEDFAKEYFNVLCGRIVSEMYQETRVAARFEQPVFHQGRYAPGGYQKLFSIHYTSDSAEDVELVHYMWNSEAANMPQV